MALVSSSVLIPPTRVIQVSQISIVLKVEYRTLTELEIAEKKLQLTQTRLPDSDVAVDIYQGPPAWLDDDFSVNGSEISWDGLGLGDLLSFGDRLRITYSAEGSA